MKVAIYARVSTTDQNCEMQLKDLREYCAARGWDIFEEYVDTGWSGKTIDRPKFLKLKADSRLRKFDCVVVWKLDRWGRSMVDCVQGIEELTRLGVRWMAITQGLDTDKSNPMSKLILSIMAAFAEFEREMIRERMQAGQKAYKAAYVAGHVGTQRHSKSGKDLPVGRRKVVFDRRRARSLQEEGRSIRDIAKALGVGAGTIHRALKPSK